MARVVLQLKTLLQISSNSKENTITRAYFNKDAG